MSIENISRLVQFGDHYKLRVYLEPSIKEDLKQFEDKWSQYNPSKLYNRRQGLCVLNERGSCGPGPALDSLYEYNGIHGTKWKEENFNKPTELYHQSQSLQELLADNLSWCCRSHFIRLQPGGFFPPHRDHTSGIQRTFRLIMPIENCNPPSCHFILENTSLFWDYFKLYFVNTTKKHLLFNASQADSIWLVINAKICKESINFVEKHL